MFIYRVDSIYVMLQVLSLILSIFIERILLFGRKVFCCCCISRYLGAIWLISLMTIQWIFICYLFLLAKEGNKYGLIRLFILILQWAFLCQYWLCTHFRSVSENSTRIPISRAILLNIRSWSISFGPIFFPSHFFSMLKYSETMKIFAILCLLHRITLCGFHLIGLSAFRFTYNLWRT